MRAARIAIWNKNRIVFMITMGIWYTNVGFLIYSKSVLLIFEN
jgi:hypothetical protein